MYQDWAWDAFVAINATTRTGQGFSAISDVNAANGGSFLNLQESFLFAEVLKYSYLIHAPVSFLVPPCHKNRRRKHRLILWYQDSAFQVAGKGDTNGFVFNTEAHPLKVVGPPV